MTHLINMFSVCASKDLALDTEGTTGHGNEL